MENLFIAFMAIVQGIAEFLPISSSGHLALLGSLFGFDPETNLSLEIVLHAGTLAAIVVFYFRELLTFFRRDRWPLALKIVVGSIPAGIVGIALKKLGLDEMVASNLWIIAAGFLTTATVLLFSERQTRKLPPDSGTDLPQMSFREALLIGCAQAVAILPGISRSGSTIASGLFLKLRPAAAAEFSFLLAIPAIGGAAFLHLLDMIKDAAEPALPLPVLAGGFAISAVVGYVSLALLLKLLKRGRLAFFSWYLYAVGTLLLGHLIIKGLI
ncbi:MAG: undecaprenyl-diphosphate phosphatase [Lentisphaeria bacterium]|nr:undecaprenyl-diphosphate phosphatase [Lentisphaeria bacterium]